MTAIYLKSSGRDSIPYITGGSEKHYMKLIADALEPYLTASGIEVWRSGPEVTAEEAIALANQKDCALYLSLYSNVAPKNLEGAMQGPDIRYYTYSREGERAAVLFDKNLRKLYPSPGFLAIAATSRLPELRHTSAPAIVAEMGYHDNRRDSLWISANTRPIARSLALSVTEYLGIPFSEPDVPRSGQTLA